jgi:hypothetical protein
MKIRGWIALAALLLLPTSLRAQTAAPDTTFPADSVAPDPVRNFVYELADPLALANALALGLYDHARTEPYEWGGGFDAMTQRIASRAGGHVIGTSVRHGLAAALGRTTEYRPCGCDGPERRIAYAITETFTDYDVQGRRRLSTPFLAGTYAGALAPVLWHPDADAAEALQSGTISLVWAIANNILNELWTSR